MADTESRTGTITISDTKDEIKLPKRYKVILHNDNYTTVDFVMFLLVEIFNKSPKEAERITLLVHHKGKGVAGVYTHEIAVDKTETSVALARKYAFPLKVTYNEM